MEEKQKVERDVERWCAAKRRRTSREASVCSSSECETKQDAEEPIDSMIYVGTKRSLSMQTELTAKEITALKVDNQKRQEEISALSSGYPTREQLQADQKLLTFYTGISHFTILLAVFEFVAKTLPISANNKLSPFDSFILTLMKLRLNPPNQDLAFRFQISSPTVSRTFKNGLLPCTTKSHPMAKS